MRCSLAPLLALVAILPTLVDGARLRDGTYYVSTTGALPRYLTFPPENLNRNATFAGRATLADRCQKWTVKTSATDSTWRTLECGGKELGYPSIVANTGLRRANEEDYYRFNIVNASETNTYWVYPYISRDVSVGHGTAIPGTPSPAQLRQGKFELAFTPV